MLEHVGFSIAVGSGLRLTGPNGSGKTTLLRLLAGLVRPLSGRILWQGADIQTDPDGHRRRVAWLGHADAVKPWMSVMENIRFWTRLRGQPNDAAEHALSRVGLAALSDLSAQTLSAGQRRRLALARVLSSGAALWLLDEPTVGLDKPSREALEAALDDHCASGGIAIVATHQPIAIPRECTLDLSPAGTG